MKKILCIGDSITKGFPFSMDASWPYILGKNNEYKTVNVGEPGQGTLAILRKVNGLNFEALKFGQVESKERVEENACPEKIAIITAGSNDFLFGLNNVEGAVANILKMAERCKDKGFRPVIGVPILCHPEDAQEKFMPGLDYARANENLILLGKQLRQLTKTHQLAHLDLQTWYKEFDQYIDGLHPTREGYEFIAEKIKEFFDNEGR